MKDHDSGGPQRVNRVHHLEEGFPMVIGFCDRDDSSHSVSSDSERHDYSLDGTMVYRLSKSDSGWELAEYFEGELMRLSGGSTLGRTLYHALIDVGGPGVPGQCNIILPVRGDQKDKALSFMYYFGGYAGSWLPEVAFEVLNHMHPEGSLVFLAFSKVPVKYLNWIADTFGGLDVLGLFTLSVMRNRRVHPIRLPGYDKPHMLILG